MLRVWIALLLLFFATVATEPVSAGAFMLPEGAGQLIAGVGYVAATRRFDGAGAIAPVPRASKAEATGFLEFGLRPWLTLIAAPTLSRVVGISANTVTGSDSSALGARLLMYGTQHTSVALQVLVQPPIGDSDRASVIADGGAHGFATDLRLMLGRSFSVAGMQAFVEADPGVRVRTDPLPPETRLDLALGARPLPRLLVLFQDFSSFAPSKGLLVQRASYSKVQGSLVYDISLRWSAQIGAFRTLVGRNALREAGPLAALWYRF